MLLGNGLARKSHAVTTLVMYSCEAVSSFVLADRAAYGPDLMRIAEDMLCLTLTAGENIDCR